MITAEALQHIRSKFRGDLITRDDPRFDAARKVFNAMIDRRPGLIARCTSPEDVAHIIKLAHDRGEVLSVRCAGHNVAGYAVCDEGVVIVLSPMKQIYVDPVERSVRVEAGATWGEVNDALQGHGLAATGGFVSVTGVSGLTLGGGFGWLMRKHGLALDNLISAQVVLADGEHVTASAAENPDLFWAIRGGGGNFGVVTSFQFRVHPAGTVFAGIVLHPASGATDVLCHWREFEKTSPNDLTQGALLFHFPDDPSAPPALRASPVIGVGGVCAGPPGDGERVLAPLRNYGPPVADLFQPMPYNAAQRMADFLWPPGLHNYWKSSYLERLSDEAIDVIADFFGRVPSRRTVVVLEYYGSDGAMQRVADSDTAFGHRGFPYNFLVTSAWSAPAEGERNIEWTRQFFEAMRPFAASSAYLNYIGDEGAAGLDASYGAGKLARLASLKAKYDPDNIFRMNQNIAPASAPSR